MTKTFLITNTEMDVLKYVAASRPFYRTRSQAEAELTEDQQLALVCLIDGGLVTERVNTYTAPGDSGCPVDLIAEATAFEFESCSGGEYAWRLVERYNG